MPIDDTEVIVLVETLNRLLNIINTGLQSKVSFSNDMELMMREALKIKELALLELHDHVMDILNTETKERT